MAAFDGVSYGNDQFGLASYDYTLTDTLKNPYNSKSTAYMGAVRDQLNDDYRQSRLQPHNRQPYRRQPLPTREDYVDNYAMTAGAAGDAPPYWPPRSGFVGGRSGFLPGLGGDSPADNLMLFLLFLILVVVCLMHNSVGEIKKQNDMLVMNLLRGST
jgi:hypothetical protein